MTMANIQTNSFIHNTGLNEENSLSHLINAMSPDSENESTLIEHSSYYGDAEFEHALQQYNSKISILSVLRCSFVIILNKEQRDWIYYIGLYYTTVI